MYVYNCIYIHIYTHIILALHRISKTQKKYVRGTHECPHIATSLGLRKMPKTSYRCIAHNQYAMKWENMSIERKPIKDKRLAANLASTSMIAIPRIKACKSDMIPQIVHWKVD